MLIRDCVSRLYGTHRATTPRQIITDANWHHVAVVVSTFGNVIYLDGVAVAIGDLTYTTGSASTQAFFDDVEDLDSVSLGRNVDSAGAEWHYDGLMDEFRVYDYALSGPEIAALAAL